MYLATHRHALSKQRDLQGIMTWDLQYSPVEQYTQFGTSTYPAVVSPESTMSSTQYNLAGGVMTNGGSQVAMSRNWALIDTKEGSPYYNPNSPVAYWYLYNSFPPATYSIRITGTITSSDIGDADIVLAWREYVNAPALYMNPTQPTIPSTNELDGALWKYTVPQDINASGISTPDTIADVFNIDQTINIALTSGHTRLSIGTGGVYGLSGILSFRMRRTSS